MKLPSYNELLEAGVHYGHLKRKLNPKMLPYIFMERKGIHIIDLNRTSERLEATGAAMKQIAKSGRKILFVATKKQAKDIVANAAKEVNMPYVTERWLGGMMTNFQTIRKSIKKMNSIDAMLADRSLSSINKKEKLTLTRERNKLEKVLGGVANINRLPTAVFVIDITHEHIAIKEAKKLGMKTFAVVDTNSNPNDVDFPIPGNDDASKSVKLICDYLVGMIKEGFTEKGVEKEAADKAAAIAKAAADKAAADKAVEAKAAAEAKSAERAAAKAAKAAKAAAQEAPATDEPAAE